MSGNNRISVLLVDDHLVVRVGLSTMINVQPDMSVVAEAAYSQEAIEMYRNLKPDVTIMDLRLPGVSGIETITAIRDEFPQARIIVLSSYDGDEDIYRALQAGARAYLLKDALRADLISAIRAVHSGQRYIPPAVATRLAERMSKSELTPRELKVLTLIVKGMSNKEIAASLSISSGTVKMHIQSILSKMNVSDRTQAATAAIQQGLVHLERY